jgi:hypothetical protein
MPNERIITVRDELERIRKEALTVYFKVPHQRFLGRQRGTTKALSVSGPRSEPEIARTSK